jgi:hypothetical protein
VLDVICITKDAVISLGNTAPQALLCPVKLLKSTESPCKYRAAALYRLF